MNALLMLFHSTVRLTMSGTPSSSVFGPIVLPLVADGSEWLGSAADSPHLVGLHVCPATDHSVTIGTVALTKVDAFSTRELRLVDNGLN